MNRIISSSSVSVIYTVCIVLMLSAVSCSEKRSGAGKKSGIYSEAPEWVLAAELSSPVSGTGRCEIDDDYRSAFSEASDNAKINLHERLNIRVRSCLFDFFGKNRDLVNEAFARISENIAGAADSGLTEGGSWRSPDSTIFVLVVSDVDVIREALKKNLGDFLEARKHDRFNPDSPKVQDELVKCCNRYFRHLQKLQSPGAVRNQD